MDKCIDILSPTRGQSISLKELNTSIFSKQISEKGGAIVLEISKIYSPINGTIISIFNDSNSICIKSNEGVEIVIHIRLNSAKPLNRYLKLNVKVGDYVEIGNLIAKINNKNIREKDYKIFVLVIINSIEFENVLAISNVNLNVGDKFIKIIK